MSAAMIGTAFVQCPVCRVSHEIDAPCPACGELPLAVDVSQQPPADAVAEYVGAHVYIGNEVHCADCGTHLSYAGIRACPPAS